MSKQLSITLVRSHIGLTAKHKAVLLGMGLNKMNKTVTLEDTPEIRGMINKVSHMVKVSE